MKSATPSLQRSVPASPVPWQRHLVMALSLAALIVLAYWQAPSNDFVNYDDGGYIVKNERIRDGLTFTNIAWAFTSTEMANWHPVTWLSYLLDATLFGAGPTGFHVTNVVLHAIVAVLLYLTMFQLTGSGWRSAMVAAIFAVHPQHVESVAWVSERKDMLSVLFGLLAIRAYLRFIAQPSPTRYLVICAWFVLSLMSKPMLVTLPALLLLLDFWPLRRLGDGGSAVPRETLQPFRFLARRVIEKLPLLVISGLFSLMTMIAQRAGGAIEGLAHISLTQRFANAAVAYVLYLRDMVWPLNLAVLYPHPGSWPTPVWMAAIGVLLIISIAAVMLWRRHPSFIMGWLWYLGTLVPVIGLVQVGEQSRADRYTYFPMIGISIALVWLLPTPRASAGKWRVVYGCLIVASLAAMTILTVRQVGYWKDSRTLFERTLAVTKNNFSAHNNLGLALIHQNEFEQGVQHFRTALELKPTLADAHANMGDALLVKGDAAGAAEHYLQVLAQQPRNAAVRTNLAAAYLKLGRSDEAVRQLTEVTVLRPQSFDAWLNLAMAQFDLGRLDEAIRHLQTAVGLRANALEAWKKLGMALAMRGRGDDAIAAFRNAVAQGPNDVAANLNLATMLLQRPNRTRSDLTEAIVCSRRASELTNHAHSGALLLLAQAQAMGGAHASAVETAERARRVAEAEGDAETLAQVTAFLSSLSLNPSN